MALIAPIPRYSHIVLFPSCPAWSLTLVRSCHRFLRFSFYDLLSLRCFKSRPFPTSLLLPLVKELFPCGPGHPNEIDASAYKKSLKNKKIKNVVLWVILPVTVIVVTLFHLVFFFGIPTIQRLPSFNTTLSLVHHQRCGGGFLCVSFSLLSRQGS